METSEVTFGFSILHPTSEQRRGPVGRGIDEVSLGEITVTGLYSERRQAGPAGGTLPSLVMTNVKGGILGEHPHHLLTQLAACT